MSSLRTIVWCSLAAPAALAQQPRTNPPSRDFDEAVRRAQNSPAVLRVKSGSLANDSAVQQITGEPVDLGSPKEFTRPDLDDSVPLPISPRFQIGDGADVQIEPASGDPYFLGFSSSNYHPPAGERIDPLLLAQLRSQYDDGRPTTETYAFVMFQKRMTDARLDVLRSMGVRTLQFHPHYTMKVALAPELVDAVASLDFVRWIGVPRPAQRMHALLQRELAEYTGFEPIDVYIDVFDSDKNADSTETVIALPVLTAPDGSTVIDEDGHAATKWMSNGWQQHALERIGIDVTEYVDSIRAFRAKLHPTQVEALLALDFVQFVELDLPAAPAAARPHDESTAIVYSDLNRAYYDGATSLSAVGGQADSGMETNHSDINAWAVGWDLGGGWPWDDEFEHGSHVAGTLLGRGNGDASKRGNAPGLGWGGTGRYFNARIFNATGGYGGASLSSIMNVLNTDYSDGISTTPRPHVINHSWGSIAGGGFNGAEADCRLIDDEVHFNGQLHIWAAGNHGTTGATIGLQPSAKNCLTVGNVVDYPSATYGDPGDLYDNASDGSANGPTADGRWKPNVVAPGTLISSVDASTANGYQNFTGTSMATPHVTGLGAQLVDHLTGLQGWPEPLSALLMTTAMTKDNATYSSPSHTHLDNFGAGRIEGYRAHWTTPQIETYYWYFGLGNTSTNVEFPINAGATRLIFTMHYSEPSASSGASQALVNNFDTYLDNPPVDTANNNTGEYVLQQSSRDNTEIRIIDSPASIATGNWRLKVWPESVTGSVYMALCAQIIYGDTTPDGTLEVAATDYYVRPNDNVTITATVTNPSFVASAVVLDSTSAGNSLQSASTTLGDGAVTNLLGNQSDGRDVTLGDIMHVGFRTATWVTRWATEGVKSWSVEARSDNWVDETQAINITVDGTPPTIPTSVTSSTHTVNVWSNNPNVTINWSGATDNLSGIDGYGVSWGTSVAGAQPANVKDTEETSPSWNVSWSSSASWYFGVNTIDNCGNWSASYATGGPYKIDTVVPTTPGPVSSTSHTVGVQSCNTTVTVSWAASTDGLSGLAGYLGVWNTTAVFDPTGSPNLGAGTTSYVANIGSTNAARYFHLRAKDVAGNYSATRHFGPIYANASSVATYCTGKTNSLGCVPAIGSVGQPDKSAGTFRVTCTNVINNKIGYVFWGYAPATTPYQGGIKCIAAPTIRTPNQLSGGSASGSDCSGAYTYTYTTAYMNTYALNPGDTLYAQWWMRDPASPSTTGLSNGLQFTVCE